MLYTGFSNPPLKIHYVLFICIDLLVHVHVYPIILHSFSGSVIYECFQMQIAFLQFGIFVTHVMYNVTNYACAFFDVFGLEHIFLILNAFKFSDL